MARNEERSNAMLNKWLSQKKELSSQKQGKRPYLASHCETLVDAEYWRRDIVKSITAKVTEIQNPGLGEPTIRDLNDEINKLFREKYHWERRIVELGGPDYTKAAHGVSSDGMELPGRRGYKYFGAARTLPGVRELFEEAAAAPVKASAAALTARVDPAYFGYCDQHEVERLEQAEAVAEAEARARAREQWRASRPAAAEPSQEAAEADGNLSAAMATGRAFVHVPAHADVQEALLQKKRAELLARFT